MGAADRLVVFAGDPAGFDDRYFGGRGQGDGGPSCEDLANKDPGPGVVLKSSYRFGPGLGRGLAGHRYRVKLGQTPIKQIDDRVVPGEDQELMGRGHAFLDPSDGPGGLGQTQFAPHRGYAGIGRAQRPQEILVVGIGR